jgi:hypothetical protein
MVKSWQIGIAFAAWVSSALICKEVGLVTSGNATSAKHTAAREGSTSYLPDRSEHIARSWVRPAGFYSIWSLNSGFLDRGALAGSGISRKAATGWRLDAGPVTAAWDEHCWLRLADGFYIARAQMGADS